MLYITLQVGGSTIKLVLITATSCNFSLGYSAEA